MKKKLRRIVSLLTAVLLISATTGICSNDAKESKHLLNAAVMEDPYNLSNTLVNVKKWKAYLNYRIPDSSYAQRYSNALDMTLYIYDGKIILSARIAEDIEDISSRFNDGEFPEEYTYGDYKYPSTGYLYRSNLQIPFEVNFLKDSYNRTDDGYLMYPDNCIMVDEELTRNIKLQTYDIESNLDGAYTILGACPEPIKHEGNLKELAGQELWTLALDINNEVIYNDELLPYFEFYIMGQNISYLSSIYYSMNDEVSKKAENTFLMRSTVNLSEPYKVIDSWKQPIFAKVVDENNTCIDIKKWDDILEYKFVSQIDEVGNEKYSILTYMTDDNTLLDAISRCDDNTMYVFDTSEPDSETLENPFYYKTNLNKAFMPFLNGNIFDNVYRYADGDISASSGMFSSSMNTGESYYVDYSNYSDYIFGNNHFALLNRVAYNNLYPPEIIVKGNCEDAGFEVEGKKIYYGKESNRYTFKSYENEITSLNILNYKGKLLGNTRLDISLVAFNDVEAISKYYAMDYILKNNPVSASVVVNQKEYDVFELLNADKNPDAFIGYSYTSDYIVHKETWNLDAYVGNKDKIPEGYSYTWLDEEKYWENPEANDKFLSGKLKDAFSVDVYFTNKGIVITELRANKKIDDDNYYVIADVNPSEIFVDCNEDDFYCYGGRVIADESTVKEGFMHFVKFYSEKKDLFGKYGLNNQIYRIPDNQISQITDNDNIVLFRAFSQFDTNSELAVFGKKFNLNDILKGENSGDSNPDNPDISVKGDANGDGTINTSDFLSLIKAIVAPESGKSDSYDLNGDGNVNSEDLMVLRKILIK